MPEGAPIAAGLVTLAVTLAVPIALLLRESRPWRVWASLIGIVAGSSTVAASGIYDLGPMRDAQWAGLPLNGWPGLGLIFGPTFWSLLPAFLFLSVISVLQAAPMGLSFQQVSWRGARTMNYRRVQGGSVCTGAGNLLSGRIGGRPITTATSIGSKP